MTFSEPSASQCEKCQVATGVAPCCPVAVLQANRSNAESSQQALLQHGIQGITPVNAFKLLLDCTNILLGFLKYIFSISSRFILQKLANFFKWFLVDF